MHPANPLPVIIRATSGKGKGKAGQKDRIKLSTVVKPDAMEGFYIKYAEVCKAGMQALQKRDRSKRKKAKKTKKKAAVEGEKKS